MRKKVSFDNAESEVSIFDQPSEREPMSEDQQLELGKQARRQSIFSLLHSQPYGHVTKPYVSSIVAMICLPDAGACKYSIQMSQKLLDLSIIDTRFIVPVAKEAFSAALSVLLQQVCFFFGIEYYACLVSECRAVSRMDFLKYLAYVLRSFGNRKNGQLD